MLQLNFLHKKGKGCILTSLPILMSSSCQVTKPFRLCVLVLLLLLAWLLYTYHTSGPGDTDTHGEATTVLKNIFSIEELAIALSQTQRIQPWWSRPPRPSRTRALWWMSITR